MKGLEEIRSDVIACIYEVLGHEAIHYPFGGNPEGTEKASKAVQDYAQRIGICVEDIKMVTHMMNGDHVPDVLLIARRIWWWHYCNQSSAAKTAYRKQLHKKGIKMTLYEQYEWQKIGNEAPLRIVGSYGSRNGG